MIIKLIDFGYELGPKRQHLNDAGADVYAMKDMLLRVHSTIKVPLGFGLDLPNGYAAYVYPRSGLSSQGITCELPPIDSGYKGEIHAIMTNCSEETYQIKKGDRIGQLVIMPVVIASFVQDFVDSRGVSAFGSTGR